MNKSKKDLKNDLKESLIRIDELETQLDCVLKEKVLFEKQTEVQKKVIHELRRIRDNSVEWSEHKVLKENFDKITFNLSESKEKIDIFTKKVNKCENEIEFLQNIIDSQTDEIQGLERSLNECLNTIKEQNAIIVAINDLRESRDYYRKQFENIFEENSELKKLLEFYRNEDINDANISVDDINESMSSFWDSVDCNANEEPFDSVFDIKLLDIEKALEEKKHLNEELKNKSKQMNEEIRKLFQLRFEFENKVKLLKIDSNNDFLNERQSFERVFNSFEKRFLTYIPFNRYFVPISRRILFSLTPLFVLRVLKILDNII